MCAPLRRPRGRRPLTGRGPSAPRGHSAPAPHVTAPSSRRRRPPARRRRRHRDGRGAVGAGDARVPTAARRHQRVPRRRRPGIGGTGREVAAPPAQLDLRARPRRRRPQQAAVGRSATGPSPRSVATSRGWQHHHTPPAVGMQQPASPRRAGDRVDTRRATVVNAAPAAGPGCRHAAEGASPKHLRAGEISAARRRATGAAALSPCRGRGHGDSLGDGPRSRSPRTHARPVRRPDRRRSRPHRLGGAAPHPCSRAFAMR